MQKRLTEQGIRFLEAGQFEKAGHILSLLITSFPENAEAHHMLGIIELEKGNYDQAFILVNTALDIDSNNSVFYNTLGNIELHRHKITNAETAFCNAVKNNPEKIEYQYNLANFYLSQNQFVKAVDHFYIILQTNPTHYLSIRGITVCYLFSGELDIALEHAEEWVKEYSEYDEPYYYLGLCLYALNDITGALAAYDKGLNIVPTNHDIMSGIGACYRSLGNLSIAETYIHNALGQEPHNPLAIYNLACINLDKNDLESAQRLFKNAISLDHLYAEPICGLGSIELLHGNDQTALKYFTEAAQLDQNNTMPKQLIATTLLRMQDFRRGWKAYTDLLTGTSATKQIPEWHGQSLTSTEALLVWITKESADLSLQIMFASILPDLHKRAEHIVLLCEPCLVKLMQASFPTLKVCSVLQIQSLDNYTLSFQIPLGALGDYFRLTAEDFVTSAKSAYLKPDLTRIQYYKTKYQKQFPNKKLVGIAWKATNNNRTIDYVKATQLIAWQKLFENTDVQFIALQIGSCENELKMINDSLQQPIYVDPEVPLNAKLDLYELSAQLSALDLILSVDCPVAHLAGGLGLPVYTLLPLQSSWYWFKESTKSHWYNNMTLMRESHTNNFHDLIISLYKLL